MDDARQPDMFGHQPAQGGLFEEPVAVTPVRAHTPDSIRALMRSLLAEARAASATPWTLRNTRSHMVMFPYMAEWLPAEEGKQLLLEFQSEMRRLGHEEPPALDL